MTHPDQNRKPDEIAKGTLFWLLLLFLERTPPDCSSINPIISRMCAVFTPETGLKFFFLLFLNDGAIGWRASSRLSCCPGWWMEISSLSFNTHSTRRLNWSPSYFSLRTCNTTATLPSLSCCPPHFFSHGRSFVHREAGTSNVNKRGSRAVSQKGRI